jgi:hypothetical protein
MNELGRALSLELDRRGITENFEGVPFIATDFEKALTFLADGMPWLPEAQRLRHRALFLDVSDALHEVLVSAQQKLLTAVPECPEWLQKLTYWMHSHEAIVITLNYDTLIEMAAAEIMVGPKRAYPAQSLQSFKFPAREGAWFVPEPLQRTLVLLKLHGSLAWSYSGRGQFFGEAIHGSGVARWSIAKEYRQYAPDEGRVPLIVPPTLSKNGFFENERLRSLWTRASQAIAQARRVFCIGYSLPEGDLLTRFLLHSVTGNETAIPFWLINCDLGVKNRFEAALPKEFVLREDFLAEGDCDLPRKFVDSLTTGNLDDKIGVGNAVIRSLPRLESEVRSLGNTVYCVQTMAEVNIRRVDSYGVTLSDSTGGSRYWPWSIIEEFLKEPLLGSEYYVFDPNLPLRTFLENLRGAPIMSVFSLFLAIGCLEYSVRDNHLCIDLTSKGSGLLIEAGS